MFDITTEHGYVLFKGSLNPDTTITLNYRADIGQCNMRYASMDAVMAIAPTAKHINYKQPDNPYPKTDGSPSVCEILNRGD